MIWPFRAKPVPPKPELRERTVTIAMRPEDDDAERARNMLRYAGISENMHFENIVHKVAFVLATYRQVDARKFDQ